MLLMLIYVKNNTATIDQGALLFCRIRFSAISTDAIRHLNQTLIGASPSGAFRSTSPQYPRHNSGQDDGRHGAGREHQSYGGAGMP